MSAHAGQIQVKVLRFKGRLGRLSTQSPRWLMMFVLSRFEIVRATVTHLRRSASLADLPQGPSLFEDLDVDRAVERLRDDGYVPGIVLPSETAGDILEFARTAQARGNGDAALGLRVSDAHAWEDENGMKLVKADFRAAAERSLAVRMVTQDPKLCEIAARYLDAAPRPARAGLWWSFACESTVEERLAAAPAQELFHYDAIDYRALFFFFYLTDVDETTGPHMVARGSHRRKKLGHRLSLFVGRSDAEMLRYYGEENVLTVTGPAGTGFAEDPFCFHRGTPPMGGDRLMMRVEFRVADYSRAKEA